MKPITVIICFLLAIFSINAQNVDLGEQVMVKAKVVDVNTKQPLSIELEFEPTTGRKFVVKSLENSGKFDQLFQSGTEYKVTYTGDNVYREETVFKPMGKAGESYSEITHTFEVKGLAPGVVVETFDVFGANSTDLTSAGKSALKKMKVLMRFNRNASFIFQVNAPTKSLADKRLNTLKDYLGDWRRLLERIEFLSGTSGNSLDIKVDKLKDVFK